MLVFGTVSFVIRCAKERQIIILRGGMEFAKEEFTFKMYRNNLEHTKLPSDRWCYIKEGDDIFGFVKADDDADATVRKRVVVLKDLSVKIIINSD